MDLDDYLGQLAAGLLNFHEGEATRIRLVLDVERGMVASPDVAAPLGLLVNEFVTNSLKHAFGADRGRLVSGWGLVRRRHQLELWDDGRGLPARVTADAERAPAAAQACG